MWTYKLPDADLEADEEGVESACIDMPVEQLFQAMSPLRWMLLALALAGRRPLERRFLHVFLKMEGLPDYTKMRQRYNRMPCLPVLAALSSHQQPSMLAVVRIIPVLPTTILDELALYHALLEIQMDEYTADPTDVPRGHVAMFCCMIWGKEALADAFRRLHARGLPLDLHTEDKWERMVPPHRGDVAKEQARVLIQAVIAEVKRLDEELAELRDIARGGAGYWNWEME